MRRAVTYGTPVRPLAVVPKGLLALLVAVLLLRLAVPFAVFERPAAVQLPQAPPAAVLAATAGGDRALASVGVMLWLGTVDHPPGVSVSYRALAYDRLAAWLGDALSLRPSARWPLLAATRIYGEVADPARQRTMIGWTRARFREDPAARWPWEAHAAYLAQHRLEDPALALAIADELAAATRNLASVPAWARQLDIFLRAALGQEEAAAVLLGALLESGAVSDPAEQAFLSRRLGELAGAPPTP